jgi:hypothetical protein
MDAEELERHLDEVGEAVERSLESVDWDAIGAEVERAVEQALRSIEVELEAIDAEIDARVEAEIEESRSIEDEDEPLEDEDGGAPPRRRGRLPE